VVDTGGRLIVVDETRHRVAVEQAGGAFRFVGEPGDGAGQFRYPRSIVLVGDRACVVDSWNHRVQLFSLPDWTFVSSFGSLGRGPGAFFCPSGIAAIDPTGVETLLAVADRNNRRLSFHDVGGTFRFAVGLDSEWFPVDVRYDGRSIEVRYEDGSWKRLNY
jgi:hypothetical protein